MKLSNLYLYQRVNFRYFLYQSVVVILLELNLIGSNQILRNVFWIGSFHHISMDSINLSKKTFCQVGYSSSPISENALLAIKVGKSKIEKKKKNLKKVTKV